MRCEVPAVLHFLSRERGHEVTRKQGLRAVGLEEVPGGGRAKMGEAREGTSKILSKKKCLQMHPGWGDMPAHKNV